MRRCPFCTRPLEESEPGCPSCGRVLEASQTLDRRVVVSRPEPTDPALTTGTIVTLMGVVMGLGVLMISGKMADDAGGGAGFALVVFAAILYRLWTRGENMRRAMNCGMIGVVLVIELIMLIECLDELHTTLGLLCLATVLVTAFGGMLVVVGVVRDLRRPIAG